MRLPEALRHLTRRDLGILSLLFVLTLPAVTPRLYSSDEVQYYSYLRSLWFDRDVSFDNEYRSFYDRGVARTPGFEATFLQPLTATGKRENFGTLGSALLWAPFYAVADAGTRIARMAGSSVPADGYARPYIAAVAYGSAFYGFAAIVLAVAAARRLTGSGLGAGLAVWFGTPLLFYMYAAPPFSHACSAFAVALFVTVWIGVRDRWTPRGLIALGAAAALMTMVREQDAFYALGPALDWLLTTIHRARAGAPDVGRRVAAAAAGVVAFFLLYMPQLLAYQALNGRFGPSRLVTRKMTWTSPHAAGVLASPEHGFFAWTPLAILAVVGLVLLCRHRAAAAGRAATTDPADVRRIAACALLMVALQVYISGSVESWTVAGAFGQRRFVGATLLLVVGLAGLWTAIPRGAPGILAAAAVGLAIWWNIGLMALFGAGLMDRQRLALRQNAHDVFVRLPVELPRLAYRYAFDRSSFYKPPQQ